MNFQSALTRAGLSAAQETQRLASALAGIHVNVTVPGDGSEAYCEWHNYDGDLIRLYESGTFEHWPESMLADWSRTGRLPGPGFRCELRAR